MRIPAGPANLLWIVKAQLAVCRENASPCGAMRLGHLWAPRRVGLLAALHMAGCLVRTRGQSSARDVLSSDGGMLPSLMVRAVPGAVMEEGSACSRLSHGTERLEGEGSR